MSKYLNATLGIFLLALGLFSVYNAFSIMPTFNWVVVGIVLLSMGLYFFFSSFQSNPSNGSFLNELDNSNKQTVSADSKYSINSKDFIKSTDSFNFTPNYSRPSRITRTPKKLFNTDKWDNPAVFSKKKNENNFKINSPNTIKELLANEDLFDESDYNEFKKNDSEEFNKKFNDFSKTDNENKFNFKNNKNNKNHENKSIKSKSEFDLNEDEPLEKETFKKKTKTNKYPAEILPIPHPVESYIISSYKTVNSSEAVNAMLSKAKNNIKLACPSIELFDEHIISRLSKTDFKLIIQDFDRTNMSYCILINSFLEQGIEIRTLAHLNSINLLIDDKEGLLVSTDPIQGRYELGATYKDDNSLNKIDTIFEIYWEDSKLLKI